MATALTLISRGLRLIGAFAAGEAIPAADAQDALVVLNDLLDAWRLESLLVYAIDRGVFALSAGVSTYTIGTGGTWNTSRPVRIEQAFFQDTTVSPVLELPMTILTDNEYESVRVKGTSSTWPLALYYDQNYPLGTVTLYPVPSRINNVVLYLWHPLSTLASLATDVALPPGYARALSYGLAVELGMEYGRPLDPTLGALAVESKARLKDLNAETPVMGLDPALVGPGGSSWNIFSDGPNWRP